MINAVLQAAPPPNPLRAYAVVTAAYWSFMLSDGALRMLVLLQFNSLGFTPVQLADDCVLLGAVTACVMTQRTY